MTLIESLQVKDRVEIEYKCGSVHKGRILVRGGRYFIAHNPRALVATRVDLDSVCSIRFSNSKVYLFKQQE